MVHPFVLPILGFNLLILHPTVFPKTYLNEFFLGFFLKVKLFLGPPAWGQPLRMAGQQTVIAEMMGRTLFLNTFVELSLQFRAAAQTMKKTMGNGVPSSPSSPTGQRRLRTSPSQSRVVVPPPLRLRRRPRHLVGHPVRILTAIVYYMHQVFYIIVLRCPRHVAGVRCPRHVARVLPGALASTRRSREWRPRV